MATEKDQANAGSEELTQEGPPMPAAEPPEAQKPTIEELQAKHAELEANYKAAQRNLEAARRQGLEASELRQETARMREDMALILDYLDGIMRAPPEIEEYGLTAQPAKPQPSRLDQLRNERLMQETTRVEAMRIGQEVENLVKEAGLDPQVAELEEARQLFMAGRFQEVVPTAKAAVAKMVRVKQEKTQKDIDSRVESIVRKRLEEAGLLEVETGGPTAGSPYFTAAQIGAMPYEEYKKHKANIDKAWREGKLK